jgi:hypothetical protein
MPPSPLARRSPASLVVFELADAPGGSRRTVVESGSDGIPLAPRAAAYRSNDDDALARLRSLVEDD